MKTGEKKSVALVATKLLRLLSPHSELELETNLTLTVETKQEMGKTINY